MPPRIYPRVNVVVTEEQHALLLELAELNRKHGDKSASASAFVRELLDRVTPLLRKTVPLMREAAKELDSSREQLREPLRDFLAEMRQLDLLDEPTATAAPARTEGTEGARTRRSRRRNQATK